MDKYDEIANYVIERVSEVIEEKYGIEPKNLTDDNIENPALINGSVYYDLEIALAEKIKEIVEKKSDGFFNIPSMCISRDDLISRFEGKDDFAEQKEKIENISDEDMEWMAGKMTDMMMDDYWYALDEAYSSLLYWQEKEREKDNGNI